MYSCVVSVVYCVLSCVCVFVCVCVCVRVGHVFVCCVCDLLCDVVWCFCVFRVCVYACVYNVSFVLYGVMFDGSCSVLCLMFVCCCC